MTARTALLAIAIATAAWLAAAPDARAQCRLCEKPTTAPQADGKEAAIELQVEAGLDFDRLVVMDEPGRAIRIELPSRVDMHSLSGGRITIDRITSDLPSTPRLDSGGRLTFRFGGRIRVSGNADGDFRGDLPITVEYL